MADSGKWRQTEAVLEALAASPRRSVEAPGGTAAGIAPTHDGLLYCDGLLGYAPPDRRLGQIPPVPRDLPRATVATAPRIGGERFTDLLYCDGLLGYAPPERVLGNIPPLPRDLTPAELAAPSPQSPRSRPVPSFLRKTGSHAAGAQSGDAREADIVPCARTDWPPVFDTMLAAHPDFASVLARSLSPDWDSVAAGEEHPALRGGVACQFLQLRLDAQEDVIRRWEAGHDDALAMYARYLDACRARDICRFYAAMAVRASNLERALHEAAFERWQQGRGPPPAFDPGVQVASQQVMFWNRAWTDCLMGGRTGTDVCHWIDQIARFHDAVRPIWRRWALREVYWEVMEIYNQGVFYGCRPLCSFFFRACTDHPDPYRRGFIVDMEDTRTRYPRPVFSPTPPSGFRPAPGLRWGPMVFRGDDPRWYVLPPPA